MPPDKTSEQKTPAIEIYQQIYKELKVNPRTLQWYATEGYIPKPEKIGSEAFYSPSAQIATRVRVINTLQKRYDLKLRDIREIVDKQAQSDWESIYDLLTAMEEHFPYIATDYRGNEFVSEKGSTIARIVCQQLKTSPVEQVRLHEAEEEWDKAQEHDLGDEGIPF